MTDRELAEEVVRRLNAIIADPDVRRDVDRLMREGRIIVSSKTNAHPSVQIGEDGRLGFLGLLNGIVGVAEDQWGYVAARYSGNAENLGELEAFEVIR